MCVMYSRVRSGEGGGGEKGAFPPQNHVICKPPRCERGGGRAQTLGWRGRSRGQRTVGGRTVVVVKEPQRVVVVSRRHQLCVKGFI